MTKLQTVLSFILIGIVGYHWHTSIWINEHSDLSFKFFLGGLLIAGLGFLVIVILHPNNQQSK